MRRACKHFDTAHRRVVEGWVGAGVGPWGATPTITVQYRDFKKRKREHVDIAKKGYSFDMYY